MKRLAFALAAVLLLGAATAAREDAVTFLRERLADDRGEAFERTGRHFIWAYAFTRGDCDLVIERREVQGPNLLVQTIPLHAVRASGDATVILACERAAGCIEQEHVGPAIRDRSTVSSVQLLPSDPADAPAIVAAFEELHRLCAKPYPR